MFVCMPTTTSVVRPRRRKSASSVVPMNALLTDFCTTGSPGRGRTSSLIATPGWPARSGDCGSVERCWMWMMGRPVLRQAACSRAMFLSRSGLLRLGSVIAEAVAAYPGLSFLARDIRAGVDPPLTVDLRFLTFTIGATLRLNLAILIGIVIAIWIFRLLQ